MAQNSNKAIEDEDSLIKRFFTALFELPEGCFYIFAIALIVGFLWIRSELIDFLYKERVQESISCNIEFTVVDDFTKNYEGETGMLSSDAVIDTSNVIYTASVEGTYEVKVIYGWYFWQPQYQEAFTLNNGDAPQNFEQEVSNVSLNYNQTFASLGLPLEFGIIEPPSEYFERYGQISWYELEPRSYEKPNSCPNGTFHKKFVGTWGLQAMDNLDDVSVSVQADSVEQGYYTFGINSPVGAELYQPHGYYLVSKARIAEIVALVKQSKGALSYEQIFGSLIFNGILQPQEGQQPKREYGKLWVPTPDSTLPDWFNNDAYTYNTVVSNTVQRGAVTGMMLDGLSVGYTASSAANDEALPIAADYDREPYQDTVRECRTITIPVVSRSCTNKQVTKYKNVKTADAYTLPVKMTFSTFYSIFE